MARRTSKPKAPPQGVHAVLPALPSPAALYQQCVALAALDTIVGSRSFALWAAKDHVHFRYSHGNGDTLDAFFSSKGHLVRGFDHESPVSPFALGDLVEGLYAGLPKPLARWTLALRDEVNVDDSKQAAATFAVWFTEGRWHAGTPALPAFDRFEGDGSSYLLGCITPQVRFVEQANVPAKLAAKAMKHGALTDPEIRTIAASANLAKARKAMAAVGYGRPFPFEAA